jgi:hypothetical protein
VRVKGVRVQVSGFGVQFSGRPVQKYLVTLNLNPRLLPARFLDAGNQAFVGQIPKTNPADAKLAVDGARSATDPASQLGAAGKLRLTLGFRDF